MTILRQAVEVFRKNAPAQTLGRYRGEHGWWQQKNLDPLKAQRGVEVAAARMTDYLNPHIVTIYTTAPELDRLLIMNDAPDYLA